MKEWYIRQSPRDRIIVLAISALTFIGLLYAFIWYPLTSGIASQRSAIESKTKDLTFLQQGKAQIDIQGPGSIKTKSTDEEPYQLIDRVVREADAGRPERVEPVGSDKARVQFSNVSFDKLAGVLAELELYNVRVDTINVTRKKEPGYVSARMTMVRK